MNRFILILFCFPVLGLAVFVGQPQEGKLYKNGIFSKKKSHFPIYMGVYFDQIFDCEYRDKIETTQVENFIAESTSEGAFLNLAYRKFSLMGFIASSRLKIKEKLESENSLMGGGGLSFILWKGDHLSIKIDGKYSYSDYQIKYFLSSEKPYRTFKKFSLIYQQYQADLAIGYKLKPFLPYVALIYNYSELNPMPYSPLIFVGEELISLRTQAAQNNNEVSLAFGCSFFEDFFDINFEGRMLGESAMTLSLAFRF